MALKKLWKTSSPIFRLLEQAYLMIEVRRNIGTNSGTCMNFWARLKLWGTSLRAFRLVNSLSTQRVSHINVSEAVALIQRPALKLSRQSMDVFQLLCRVSSAQKEGHVGDEIQAVCFGCRVMCEIVSEIGNHFRTPTELVRPVFGLNVKVGLDKPAEPKIGLFSR